MDKPESTGTEGVTGTERRLFQLCRQSFLSLWSYANLFRDQRADARGDGKELCDVLVIFGNDLILFSDKACEMKAEGNEHVNWQRWYRRAIEQSFRQLLGAERWIRERPERIFLDRACTEPLPLAISPDDMRVHKVIVASGAADLCKARLEGSGSLMSMHPDHLQALTEQRSGLVPAFVLPQRTSAGETLNVLDETTLPIILQELDTIGDYLEYLTMRQDFLDQDFRTFVTGEEELLGLFLGMRAQGMTSLAEYVSSSYEAMVVAEGIYADVVSGPAYAEYSSENMVSYLWDFIIENHTFFMRQGWLVPPSPVSIADKEWITRELAAETRVHRRLLATALIGVIEQARSEEIVSRVVNRPGMPTYVFQVVPRTPEWSDGYRKNRQDYLQEYCFLTCWRDKQIQEVIGISLEGVDPFTDAYDICVLHIDQWSPEMEKAGKELEADFTGRKAWQRITKSRAVQPTAWGDWPEVGDKS